MSEILEGKVLSSTARKDNSSGSGWGTCQVVLEDGKTYKIGLQPNATSPAAGDSIRALPGKFAGVWNLEQAEGKKEAASSNGSPTKTPYQQKDDYWTSKATYEEKIRDPKIEAQFYVGVSRDIYAAGIPHLAEPPTTQDELDAYIEGAVDKGIAIYEKINKVKR